MELREQPNEQSRVASLLPELVQDVRDLRIGEVPLPDDVHGETRGKDRLEADAGRGDRRDLLAGEQGALLGREIEVQSGHAQQLVREDLPGPDFAGHVDVRLDDPLQRRRREPVDALLDARSIARNRVGHGSSLRISAG